MKKFWKLLVVAVLSVSMLLGMTACSDNSIIVQTNAEFAPFEYMTTKGEIVGVDIDIMNMVGEKMGKGVKFVNGDFDPIVDIVSEGKQADVGAAGITITDARKAKVAFSKPYYTSIQYVIWAKTDTSFKTTEVAEGTNAILWTDLANKKIGVQRGTTGDIYVSDEIDGGALKNKGAQCVQYDSAPVASNAIGSNIDCVVVDKLPAQYITKNNKFQCAPLYYASEENGTTTYSATSEDYAICVTKGKDDILKAINEVLDELIADVDSNGENGIDRLVAKHLGVAD